MTSSCTDALEMAALVLGLAPGDEVVMPSWTFPSTANAFALRGAIPVFVDVEPDTLNIDVDRVAAALSSRTRAVVCVHYAGVACDMARLRQLCCEAGIALVEDAAQAFGATWNGQPLGGLGDLGAFSFHGSKNVSCGEGGALIVVRDDLLRRAEIAWEKGTNRASYLHGKVDRYQWCDLGSSFLPSEVTAAFLSAQLPSAQSITQARRRAYRRYEALLTAAAVPGLRLPRVPDYSNHNAHIYAVQLDRPAMRPAVLAALAQASIDARTHYQPLHSSPAGLRLGRASGSLAATTAAAAGLIRLPLDTEITAAEQERVVGVLVDAIREQDISRRE